MSANWLIFTRDDRKKLKQDILCETLLFAGGITGFVLANPILLFDTKTYLINMDGVASDFSIRYLGDVLYRKYIEWDLVNSGGMEHTFILLPVLLWILVDGAILSRDKITWSALPSIALLLAMCCKGRFLGWYLLPLLYFAPLCVCNCKNIIVAALINTYMLLPETKYQVLTKLEQIESIRQDCWITEYTETINQLYCEYRPVYFIDIGIERPMDAVWAYDMSSPDKQVIYISNRARANSDIDFIFQLANKNISGYSIADTQRDISVILKNND